MRWREPTRISPEALERIGYPAPRQREPGFATLIQIIAAQQVSTASAAAICRKLAVATGRRGRRPKGCSTLDDAAMRAAGFSRPEGGLCPRAGAGPGGRANSTSRRSSIWRRRPPIASLTRLKGFGRWSAEIYLLFAHGRVDVFPADDLAVQIAYQRLKRLEARPTGKALRLLAEPWRPFRGAAAVFLWHYYGAATLDGSP